MDSTEELRKKTLEQIGNSLERDSVKEIRQAIEFLILKHNSLVNILRDFSKSPKTPFFPIKTVTQRYVRK